LIFKNEQRIKFERIEISGQKMDIYYPQKKKYSLKHSNLDAAQIKLGKKIQQA